MKNKMSYVDDKTFTLVIAHKNFDNGTTPHNGYRITSVGSIYKRILEIETLEIQKFHLPEYHALYLM